MTPPPCGETALDRSGSPRTCVLDSAHEGDHFDGRGRSWEPPGVTLARLRRSWGRTHRIVWTGSLWMATAHARTCRWRTVIEPTPAQLEEGLRRHASPPPPPPRRPS